MTVYCVQEDEGTLRSLCVSDAFAMASLVCCCPLFTSFDDERMSSTNVLDFADEDLRAKMLGDAIPAESFAAGRTALDGFDNYEYLGNAEHGWPTKKKEWKHSDIKNVDYRYVQDFFKHIKEATEQ